MKHDHPIARFVGNIIGHLILAAAGITAITIPVFAYPRRLNILEDADRAS